MFKLITDNGIVVGIIGGLLSSLIVWIVVLFFQKIAIPWFDARQYIGINIEGTWISTSLIINEDQSNSKYQDTLELRQHGCNISGTYSCRNETSNDILTSSYNCFGKIVAGECLILNYEADETKYTGYGNFLLKITLGGREMVGSVNFIELQHKNIVAFQNLNFKKIA